MPRSAHPAAREPTRSAAPQGGAPVAALVAGWPGPALLVTAAAGLTAVSAAGRALVEADGPDAPWRRALFAWLDGTGQAHDPAPPAGLPRAASTAGTTEEKDGRPVRHVSEILRNGGARLVEWTAVALPDNTVALLGSDVTLERVLHEALVDSRRRLRALVDIAGDLAFEVDADGRFAFLSPDRVLGRAADTLIGAPAEALLDQPGLARSPLEARRPLRDVPVVLADVAGRPVAARVTARPILDAEGGWAGARGLVRFEPPAAGTGGTPAPARDAAAAADGTAAQPTAATHAPSGRCGPEPNRR